jgi:hypothetical protein
VVPQNPNTATLQLSGVGLFAPGICRRRFVTMSLGVCSGERFFAIGLERQAAKEAQTGVFDHHGQVRSRARPVEHGGSHGDR